MLHVHGDRVYLHAGLLGAKVPSVFKRQRDILDNLEVDLEAKGITKYYTVVKTPRQYRYAKFMGFELNGEFLVGTAYEVMEKEL